MTMAGKEKKGVRLEHISKIYKDPKTDQDGLKKSQKGCCMVSLLPDGDYTCVDGYSEWVPDNRTVLRPVYKDGQLINKMTFQEVRANLYPEV